MNTPITSGVHHIGLAVSKLEETAAFFTQTLGWQEVRRDADYPAVFVSDGVVMVSLWRVNDPETARAFDRKCNIGLHHVAFGVDALEKLHTVHDTLLRADNVTLEFSPELIRNGPAMHMMCTEPSGIRVEFIWMGT